MPDLALADSGFSTSLNIEEYFPTAWMLSSGIPEANIRILGNQLTAYSIFS